MLKIPLIHYSYLLCLISLFSYEYSFSMKRESQTALIQSSSKKSKIDMPMLPKYLDYGWLYELPKEIQTKIAMEIIKDIPLQCKESEICNNTGTILTTNLR